MDELETRIAVMVRSELAAEANAGFPTARRIPSTDAVKFLDYCALLDAAERSALLDALAKGIALQFFPPEVAHERSLSLVNDDPALVQFRKAMQSGHFAYGLRYADLRMARQVLKDPESMTRMAQTRSRLDFVPRDDPPSDLMPEPDRLKAQPAKAPLLRKLINKAFDRVFSPTKGKLPGGTLQFSGTIGSTELKVSIVFSALYAQLGWWVNMRMSRPNLRAVHVRDFWGATGWDYLTEENAARSVDLLCERIVYLANLRERIDALA
ncbi:MAG: hypothetical protein JO092_10415 [Candidatus Eremiobacteraeota bacterium]|nr:hypothetical protein [Candidatus Eremiobacteraeota bacterium]